MKAEALAFLDGYPDSDSCRPQMVGDTGERGTRSLPAAAEMKSPSL
jgi:hypothetical protein